MLGGPFIADWQSQSSVWDAFRRTCTPSSSARRILSSLRNQFSQHPRNYLHPKHSNTGPDFQFTRTTDSTFDFCHSPWAHFSQGLFFSNWRTFPALYPVFSPSKGPGFMDIRIPSHYYYGSTPRYTYAWDAVNLELKGTDPSDMPWEKKDDRIFWRGASTGGGNTPQGFSSQYQRHRFIRMASDNSTDSRTVTFPDPSSPTTMRSVNAPIADLNREIMDVAFVSAIDPDTYQGGLDAMMRDHRFAEPEPLGRFWNYKYVIDLDGNGYSGRFMAFLGSDSAVIKATIFREFFEDWLIPWYALQTLHDPHH